MTLNLEYVVIDTNVFLHAQNRNEDCFSSAQKFLEEILNSETKLGLDRDGLILKEYAKHILGKSPGFGLNALAKLLNRKHEFDRQTPRDVKRFIKGTIRKHNSQRDRTFLAVAYNSKSNSKSLFVCHDFTDFTPHVRAKCDRCIGVVVPCAGYCYHKQLGKCVDCRKWDVSIPTIRC